MALLRNRKALLRLAHPDTRPATADTPLVLVCGARYQSLKTNKTRVCTLSPGVHTVNGEDGTSEEVEVIRQSQAPSELFEDGVVTWLGLYNAALAAKPRSGRASPLRVVKRISRSQVGQTVTVWYQRRNLAGLVERAHVTVKAPTCTLPSELYMQMIGHQQARSGAEAAGDLYITFRQPLSEQYAEPKTAPRCRRPPTPSDKRSAQRRRSEALSPPVF